ncbi:lytic murein transglycosylase [uncultured Litoreibacter sp.]|uniref:lytic murein transglycosylase n=1 Tax=uncultured Litoreibacter sp. TaxID=1392394 RepID=UPI0026294D47|nr:lytic murein transglycosylase [uncultured Litoreibacter sp.]
MRGLVLGCVLAALPVAAQAQSCGGSFSGFVSQLKSEAVAKGHPTAQVNAFFQGVRQDPKVIKADRSQGVFKKGFTEFARAVISKGRVNKGRANAQKYASVFRRAQQEYGIPPGVLLAFWALETDYGSFQGNFNTLNALVTLSHDCRRPELFRPQVFAALELFERGGFDPRTTTGAWAGEIGMVQMLPEDIIRHGVDADGNGRVDLKGSPPDALISGAKMLRSFGWQPGQPWLQEVVVPAQMDWSNTGLGTTLPVDQWAQMGVKPRSGAFQGGGQASILLPQGRKGPAFIAYPNYRVYFDWNQSFTYVTTAAYFATRLSGAPVFDPGSPEPGLNDAQMRRLQKKLAQRGYDVGKIDGILGAGTRAAVQAEQQRLGLPADAWPTAALLQKL